MDTGKVIEWAEKVLSQKLLHVDTYTFTFRICSLLQAEGKIEKCIKLIDRITKNKVANTLLSVTEAFETTVPDQVPLTLSTEGPVSVRGPLK